MEDTGKVLNNGEKSQRTYMCPEIKNTQTNQS